MGCMLYRCADVRKPRRRDQKLTHHSASNIYGFPSLANFDPILSADHDFISHWQMPKSLLEQLKIAQFSNMVMKTLYCNDSHPSGLPLADDRASALNKLSEEFNALDKAIGFDASSKWPCYNFERELTLSSDLKASASCRRRPPSRICIHDPSRVSQQEHQLLHLLQYNLRLLASRNRLRNFYRLSP